MSDFNNKISDYDLITAYNVVNHILKRESVTLVVSENKYLDDTFLLVDRTDNKVIGEFNNLFEAIVSTYKFHQDWLFGYIDDDTQGVDELILLFAAFIDNQYCRDVTKEITPAVYKDISEDFFIKGENADKFIYQNTKYIVSKGITLKLLSMQSLTTYENNTPLKNKEYLYNSVILEAAEVEMNRFVHNILLHDKKAILNHAYDYSIKCEILGRIRDNIIDFFSYSCNTEDAIITILYTRDFVDFCYNAWFDSDEDFCENLNQVIQAALEEKTCELIRLRLGTE